MTQQNKDQKVILTGIKPSGMPHLGNYCGAIKPMVDFINNKKDNETIYCFIPDIHVVNGGLEPAKIREYSYGMIATYLACGMDPEKVVMFRQSAVRQHAELATMLNNFTPKGMMNRAHSYKAVVDKNKLDDDFGDLKKAKEAFIAILEGRKETFTKFHDILDNLETLDEYIETITDSNTKESMDKVLKNFIKIIKRELSHKDGIDELRDFVSDFLNDAQNQFHNKYDAGINMGLYNYPILMAADILLYHTNTVPVGKDQIQHIEMARDIANSFNHRYSETFTLPDYESKEDAPEISGLDGRKMSKSYGNHIPMFCNEMELKGLIKKIITDSAKPEEEKDVENSTLVQLYSLFADEAKTTDYKQRLAKGGFGYGDAKMELFEVINAELAPKREIYNELMKDRKALEAILRDNEEQARRVAEKTMRKVRKKMGLVDVI